MLHQITKDTENLKNTLKSNEVMSTINFPSRHNTFFPNVHDLFFKKLILHKAKNKTLLNTRKENLKALLSKYNVIKIYIKI